MKCFSGKKDKACVSQLRSTKNECDTNLQDTICERTTNNGQNI